VTGQWIAVVMCAACAGSASRGPSSGPTVFKNGQIEIKVDEIGADEPIDITLWAPGLTRSVDAELTLTGRGVAELAFTRIVSEELFQGCDPVKGGAQCQDTPDEVPAAHVRMKSRLRPGTYQLRVQIDEPTLKVDETLVLRVGSGPSERFAGPPIPVGKPAPPPPPASPAIRRTPPPPSKHVVMDCTAMPANRCCIGRSIVAVTPCGPGDMGPGFERGEDGVCRKVSCLGGQP
jgi:hypothetical protein